MGINWRETRLYSLVTRCIGLILMEFRDNTSYITDDLGGDFKVYVNNIEFDKIWKKTTAGLGEDSINTITILKNRFKKFPSRSEIQLQTGYSIFYLFKNYGGFKKIGIEKSIDFYRFWRRIVKFWQLPGLEIEDSVFYYKHGLDKLNNKSKLYLRQADFLDIGSFQGDSAISLFDFDYKKIHCFDLSAFSLRKLESNLKRMSIPETRYCTILSKVGSQFGITRVLNDTGKSNLKEFDTPNKNRSSYQYELPEITIDKYCTDTNISPKLIKADVEGALMNVILGAKNTIIQNRPILTLAIYHNPIEFFEVKPLLESWVENYKFEIRKLTHRTGRNSCHIETFLIGIPGELL